MKKIRAEPRIERALQLKLKPDTKFLILIRDLVIVYKEITTKFEGPCTVTKVSKKDISISDGTKVKPLNISTVV